MTTRINSRSKGAAGEREFCKYLQEQFDLENLPQRNLDQVRAGGADIIASAIVSHGVNIPEMGRCVFEVKRVQSLDLSKWWLQVKRATTYEDMPIVAFRRNSSKWEFLIPSAEIGVARGFIQLREYEFTAWMYNRIITPATI